MTSSTQGTITGYLPRALILIWHFFVYQTCKKVRITYKYVIIYISLLQFSSIDTITLIEGQGITEVTFTSYIPPRLFCDKYDRDYGCRVELEAAVRPAKELKCSDGSDLSQVVFFQTGNSSTDTCGTEISTTGWNDAFKLYMKARIDGVNDGDKIRSLQLTLIVTQSGEKQKYDVGRIELKIKDMDQQATCSSINDPHMTTFDNTYV